MTSGKKATIKTSGESILSEAMKRPGVAEVLRIYDKANKQVQASERTFERIKSPVVFSSSDST